MREALLIIVLIMAAIALGVHILVLLERMKALRKAKDFMEKAESAVIPAVEELREVLKNIKDITGEISGMAKDVRQLTTAFGRVGGEVQELASLIDATVVKARASIGGIRAGFQTALSVLVKNLLRKGGNSNGKSSL